MTTAWSTRRATFIGLILALLAILGVTACAATALQQRPGPAHDAPDHHRPADHRHGSDAAGTSPQNPAAIDADVPAVTGLRGSLRDALRSAQAEATRDDVTLLVNSGWRSVDEQEVLFDEAVEQYGSVREAARWVASPDRSRHVAGDAVDIGSYDAADWLHRNGARFGLCRTYDNEAWHFEYVEDAERAGCPRMFADSSADTRAMP